MARPKLDGAHTPELLVDLEESVREFADLLDRARGQWTASRPGKWTAGQHAEHVAILLGTFADALEQAERRIEDGPAPPRPHRGFLQRLIVRLLTGAKFPRGGRSPVRGLPLSEPDRRATLARLRGESARFRALLERLSPEERDQLWIPNPLVSFRWHYTLPEVLRVQAAHTRHHCQLVREIGLG